MPATVSKGRVRTAAKNSEGTIDVKLKPEVLTDKDDTKIVGCRTCKRPCVVTRFASAAKVCCSGCREQAVAPDRVHEFDESKEEHVLTDKDKSKRLPCRSCGRPCIVNVFAAPEKVACKDCRTFVPRPKRTTEYNGREVTEKVEIMDREDVKRAMGLLMRQSLPNWPDGDKESRARLIELAAAKREADFRFADELDVWINAVKAAKVAKEPKPPEHPALVEAREDREIAKNQLKTQREQMVKALLKKGRENAYADIQDKNTIRVEQMQVKREVIGA